MMIGQIEKRDGRIVSYDRDKVKNAILKAADCVEDTQVISDIDYIVEEVELALSYDRTQTPDVELIQDTVEEVLMANGYTDVAKEYILYRVERNKKRQEKWLKDDFALSIWENKYRYDNESFDDFIERIAGGRNNIFKRIKAKKFLPAGRILANRDLQNRENKKITYSNCYALPSPQDNIESIFDIAGKLARTFSYGGGAGIDISELRPRNSKVNNAAKKTSGAVSFMKLYNTVTSIIGQEGRRGALMISCSVEHPDIEEFIEIKNDLGKINKANISVRITDKFMRAVQNSEEVELYFQVKDTGEVINDTISAERLFNKIAYSNWNTGEPGMLFWDNIEQWNLLSEDPDFTLKTTNPCLVGETLVNTITGQEKIEDLVGTQPAVYTVDDKGRLYIEQASEVWKTKEDAELVKVETTSNRRGTLKCTPDHRVKVVTDIRDEDGDLIRKEYEWKEAQNLDKGDRILGLTNSVITYNIGDEVRTSYKVKSVKELEETADVYDMKVNKSHTFFASSLAVHNCGKYFASV